MKYKVCLSILFLLIFSVSLIAADIAVSKSAVPCINGQYKEKITGHGYSVYTKDNVKIKYIGKKNIKWMIFVDGKPYYRNRTDSQTCPLKGWEIVPAAKKAGVQETKLLIQNKATKERQMYR